MGIIQVTRKCALVALLVALVTAGQSAVGQDLPSAPPGQSPQESSLPSPSASDPRALVSGSLFDFKDSDVKFNLGSLMKTLRDSKHEGWVLAAYPDPKTSRPLIGAGFSLDVDETEHIQRDPLNPNQFLEPSSARLWQAAGLDSGRLQRIIEQFDRNLKAWKKKTYRRKIRTHALPPQLTDAEAMSLLRISGIQAIHNARAYCRNFDQLTASQQMALSQLVFQMGVNLEEFVQFLAAINGDDTSTDVAASDGGSESEAEHWKIVQGTLIESQWARRYSTRAANVIAMFDPSYVEDPLGAERRVLAVIHPPAKHHRKKPHQESVRARNDTTQVDKMTHKKAASSQ